jgi:hypothetical protein
VHDQQGRIGRHIHGLVQSRQDRGQGKGGGLGDTGEQRSYRDQGEGYDLFCSERTVLFILLYIDRESLSVLTCPCLVTTFWMSEVTT